MPRSEGSGSASLAIDCLVWDLNLAARRVRQNLESHFARQRITFAAWIALSCLERQGPAMQRELAQRLDIKSPTMARQLERLERLGLVLRRRSASDRRVALVELTPNGRAMVAKLETVIAGATRELAAGLDDSQIEQLSVLLGRVAAPRGLSD